MGWFTELRALAYLKRLTLATERLAVHAETLARISQDDWEARHAPRPRGKFVSGVMDQAAANERWHQMQESERSGE